MFWQTLVLEAGRSFSRSWRQVFNSNRDLIISRTKNQAQQMFPKVTTIWFHQTDKVGKLQCFMKSKLNFSRSEQDFPQQSVAYLIALSTQAKYLPTKCEPSAQVFLETALFVLKSAVHGNRHVGGLGFPRPWRCAMSMKCCFSFPSCSRS